jgi:hypothetical protein
LEHGAEATVTTDKDFKRLVRIRAALTGESYSAVRRRLQGSTTGGSAMRTSDPLEEQPTIEPARRATQMFVMTDITSAIERYERLGFARIPTEDEGCIGMLAGSTGVILVTTEFIEGDLGTENAETISGRTINYVWVRSVDRAKESLPPGAIVLNDVVTRIGTRELLVDDDGDLLILAETDPRLES